MPVVIYVGFHSSKFRLKRSNIVLEKWTIEVEEVLARRVDGGRVAGIQRGDNSVCANHFADTNNRNLELGNHYLPTRCNQ